MDGEELVSGQSPGPNVAVNTKGSVYLGKSRARASVRGKGGTGAPAELGHAAFLSPWAPGADRPRPPPSPQAELPT